MKSGQQYPSPSLSEMNKLQQSWKFHPSTARTLNGFFRQYGWTRDSFYTAMDAAAAVVYSFQVNVPHSVYGKCDYFIPEILRKWIVEHDINYYSYCGGSSGGDGYTNGVTNRESVYSIRNTQETDALAFQIQFPKCKVHEFKSYDYSKI